MLLLLNIQDFLEKTVRGEVTLPKQLVEEFKTACGEAVDKQFSKPKDKERLRAGLKPGHVKIFTNLWRIKSIIK